MDNDNPMYSTDRRRLLLNGLCNIFHRTVIFITVWLNHRHGICEANSKRAREYRP